MGLEVFDGRCDSQNLDIWAAKSKPTCLLTFHLWKKLRNYIPQGRFLWSHDKFSERIRIQFSLGKKLRIRITDTDHVKNNLIRMSIGINDPYPWSRDHDPSKACHWDKNTANLGLMKNIAKRRQACLRHRKVPRSQASLQQALQKEKAQLRDRPVKSIDKEVEVQWRTGTCDFCWLSRSFRHGGMKWTLQMSPGTIQDLLFIK